MSSAIILDCHSVGWTSAYAMTGLQHEGQDTNVIFGFFKTLLDADRFIETPATVIFCWDSHQSRRKMLFPGYKAGRQEKVYDAKDEAIRKSTMQQIFLIRDEIVPQLGFNNSFLKTGFEADDIVACVANMELFDEQLIISTDNDLLQLLSDKTSIYSPKTSAYTTKQSFTDKYEIPPSKWAAVKAMAGCSSDDVPGISGVGEKGAIDFILNRLPIGKKLEKIEKGLRTPEYLRDRRLVTLPYAPLEFDIVQDNIRARAFFDMCKQYNLLSFMRKATQNRWRLLLDFM